MSNTRLPISIICLYLLKKMLWSFKIWPRWVVLYSLQFHKHFGIEICFFMLLNFEMT